MPSPPNLFQKEENTMTNQAINPATTQANTQATNNPNGSTGPTTAAGKFESSKNALKHGLTSESIDRFPLEIRDAYKTFLNNLYIEINPQTTCECDYLEQYAFNRFMVQRGQAMLSSVYIEMTADPANEILEKRYAKLSRHVKALERSANNALKELRLFIADRLLAVEVDAHIPDAIPGLSMPVAFPSHRLLDSKARRLGSKDLALRFVQETFSRMPAPQEAANEGK